MTDRLGGYWLGARLDGGGQVVVREAYDESGARHALGVPWLPDADARARLAASAEAAEHVRSLSVAKLTAVCLDGEPPYLVSEYIEGPTLRQVVERHGPYAGDDLYRLAAATATALAAVHEAGAVHGALTPEKVVLGAEGPRLVGLGLAGDGGGPPADVHAWGRLLVFAAYGPDAGRLDGGVRLDGGERFERPLRGLVAAALRPDPERRPSARQLLMSLLDVPQSQQGRLLPPEPIDDPPLGARAEAVYAGLSPAEQDLVPDVFLRLVGLDAEGADAVVSAGRDELVAGRGPDEVAAIDGVLAAYGEAGLIGEPPAITHGALLRAWPRLREWLDGERAGLAVHRELAEAARRWEAGGRRESQLFQGEPLDRALAWAAGARRRVTLSAGEQTFLDEGLANARRRARRRRTVMAGLLSAAMVAVLLALWQRGVADERLDETMARVAASRAEALRVADPVTARKLGLAAWSLAPIPESRRALAAHDPAVEVFADPHAGPRTLHAITADGATLAALDEATLRLYDLNAGGRLLATTGGPAQSVRAMAWSPDGRTLALVGVDRSYLYDLRTGILGRPFGRGLGAPGEQSAWFSPGGGLLFAAARQSGERWAWDLRAGRAAYVGEYAVIGPGDRVALVFDGKDSQIRRPGRASPAPWLDRMPWEYTTFAPDGVRVAIAEETGIQIYGLDGVPTHNSRYRPSPGHLRFSWDGRLLVSTDSDRVRVWRLDHGTRIADRQVPAAADRHAQAAISADGRWLRVLAGRGTVLTIDLAAPSAPARPESWVCERYGPLSAAEWRRHLPEVPYQETC
ncbi:nSTAND1 domain-containing NTPase [Nonomuraea rubra]|uniref:nSTAND1 domain-containing NTPase n=1 Tax=Nonomuraea rubra TaxID=46180 RepID=UPI0033CD1CE0